jgi:hypothetical protein
MYNDKYIFSQIVELLPRRAFDTCVERYNGNKNVYNLSCRDQFLALMFGQLTNLNSLRSIVLCLNAHPNSLYHLGFKTKKFTLSTLSRANQNRDWRIWQDFTDHLIKKARRLYIHDNDFSIDLDNTIYALDSTIIDLCLATFKWAYFELSKSAVKIHTQLDLKGNIPSFFIITKAKTHDVNFLDHIEFEKDAIYIMDRGYLDFKRLYTMHTQSAYFIVRSKKSLSFKRIYSRKVDRTTGLRCDQTIRLKAFYAKKKYKDRLRRIKYYDKETNTTYVYLTNNFNIPAKTIADLYKQRWQIELFFKWIKQHLKIQVFWGYSFNAVKTQICIAISTFLIVAIAKKQLKVKKNLYNILQILQVSQFEKTALPSLISNSKLHFEENKRQMSLDLEEF